MLLLVLQPLAPRQRHTHPLAEMHVVLQPNHHRTAVPAVLHVLPLVWHPLDLLVLRRQPLRNRPQRLNVHVSVQATPGVQGGVSPQVCTHHPEREGAVHLRITQTSVKTWLVKVALDVSPKAPTFACLGEATMNSIRLAATSRSAILRPVIAACSPTSIINSLTGQHATFISTAPTRTEYEPSTAVQPIRAAPAT